MTRHGPFLALLACACIPVACAFLSKLPLEVVTISPAPSRSSDHGAERSLSGRDSITVVFSRAVIALGADFDASPPAFTISPSHVPGRFRWVTTAIARFDPSIDWPAELKIEVAPVDGLTTFDGTRLAAHTAVRFRTPRLRMWLGSVDSPSALNATGGLWDSSTAMVDREAREVPADGSILLQFSEAVQPSLALAALQLRALSSSFGPRELALALGCGQDGRADNRTVCVRPAEPLSPSKSYELSLRTGHSCHPLQGRTSAASSVRLVGLEPFFLPYLQAEPPPARESYREMRPRYRRLDLWLKHGLSLVQGTGASGVPAGDAATLAALRGAISLEPQLPFNLSRPAPGVLRLEAPLEGRTTYTVRVSALLAKAAGVRDAFGQPLVPDPRPPEESGRSGLSALTARLGTALGSTTGESTTFRTAALPTFFADSDGHAHFAPPRGAPETLTVWARGADQCLGADLLSAAASAEIGACAPAGAAQRAEWLGKVAALVSDRQLRRKVEADPRFGKPLSVSLAPVDADSLPAAIASVLSGQEDFVRARSTAIAPLSDSLQPVPLPTGPALAPSGLAVRTRWGSYDRWASLREPGESGARKASTWLGFPRYGALLLASVVPTSGEAGELALWVTKLAAPGGPAANVRVRLFAHDGSRRSRRSARPEDIEELASAQTDAAGLAILQLPARWASRRADWQSRLGESLTLYAALLSTDGDGHISLVPNLRPRPRTVAPVGAVGSVVTDAAVYRRGDSVRLKGWLRERKEQASPAPSAPSPLASAFAEAAAAPALSSGGATLAPSAAPVSAAAVALAVPLRHRRLLQLRVRWRAPAQQDENRGFGFAGAIDGGEPSFGGGAMSAASSGGEAAAGAPANAPAACGAYQPPDGSACAEVEADADFGSFHALLPVPADADHTQATIEVLRVDAPAPGAHAAEAGAVRFTHVASASLTVAEPRLPTVTLQLAAVDGMGAPVSSFSTFADGAPVRLRARTATYTGAPVGGAAVSLHWDLSLGGGSSGEPSGGALARSPDASWVSGLGALRPEHEEEGGGGGAPPSFVVRPVRSSLSSSDVLAAIPARPVGSSSGSRDAPAVVPTSGVLEAVTGEEDGEVTLTIDEASQPAAFAALRRAREGGSLSVRAEWVGPTRELITASASLRAAADESGARLSVALAHPLALPGSDLALATHLEHSGADGSGAPALLDVALYAQGEAPTEANVRARGALAGTPAAQARCTAGAKSFGSEEGGCVLRMPQAALQYVLVACAVAAAPARACAAVRVGTSETGWREARLRSVGDEGALFADKLAYKVGQQAVVSWHAPLAAGSHGIALWGDEGRLRAARLGPLAAGANHLVLPLGAECATGCTLTLALASGARAEPLALAPGVGASALLETQMPTASLRTLRLAVEHAPPSLDVAISVRAADGSGGGSADAQPAASLLPGSSARVRLRLTDAATGLPVRGEVSLLVVDKAMLDVSPHPLAQPAAAFDGLRARDTSPPEAQLTLHAHADADDSMLLSARAHEAATGALARLFAREPWLEPPQEGSWAAAAYGRGPWVPGVRGGTLADCADAPEEDTLAPLRSVLTRCPLGCDWDGAHAVADGGGSRLSRRFGGRGAMLMFEDAMEESEGAMPMLAMAAVSTRAAPMAAPKMAMRAMGMEAPPAAEAASGGGGRGGGGGGGATVPALRTHFERVALFAPRLVVPASGELEVPWQLPDNVGTWSVRAYAAAAAATGAGTEGGGVADGADPAAAFGQAEVLQLAARPLSLVPSVPRFARVGDRFEAGVSARIVDVAATFAAAAGTGGSSESAEVLLELTVTVTLPAAGAQARAPPLRVEPGAGARADGVVASRRVRLSDAHAPIELSVELSAVGMGTANLTMAVRAVRATDGALLAADSLAHALAVEAASPSVVVATSFSIDGDASRVAAVAAAAARAVSLGLATAAPAALPAAGGDDDGAPGANCALVPWSEGLALPAAVPGSGSLAITAGVGYEAASRQLAERAAASAAEATRPDARADALVWTSSAELLAAVLGAPLANSTYAPGEQRAAEPAPWFGPSVAELARRSSSDGTGLCAYGGKWCVPYEQRAQAMQGRRGEMLPPEAFVDTRLHSLALLLLAEAELGGSSRADPAARVPAALRALAPAWAGALARALAWRASEEVDHAGRLGEVAMPASDLCWAAAALGVGWADLPAVAGAPRTMRAAAAASAGAAAAAADVPWAVEARSAAEAGAASARTARARVLLGSAALHEALEKRGGADSECDALAALAVLRPPPPAARAALGARADAAADAERALARLVGALRVTGRTSYIATAPGSPSAAPARTQALALRAFAAATAAGGSGAPVELVPRLAMVVATADGAAGGGGWRYGGWGGDGENSALRLGALCAYDLATGSAAPQLRFEALAGTSPLLRAAFVAERAHATRVRLPWEALTDGALAAAAVPGARSVAPRGDDSAARSEPLLFFARGLGRVGVAVELDFAPAPRPGATAARYRGLYVERALRTQGGAGGALTGPLVLGSIVQVVLSVTTADDVSGLVIEDRPPAGLEPLDPAVYGAASAPADSGAQPCPLWYGWLGSRARSGWGGCQPSFERDISPSLVRWRAHWAGAGTHTLSYSAMVATAGTFALAPAHAFLAAQPELMGLSAAGQLSVVRAAPPAGSAAAAGAPLPPRECTDLECGGHGSCDVARGVCECSSGWEGDACELQAPERELRVEQWPAGSAAPAGPRGGVRLRFGLVPVSPHGRRLAPSLPGPSGGARYAYAFSSDEKVLPSANIRIDAADGSLSLAPPEGGQREPGSAYLTLAVSEDGARVHSAVVLLSLAADGKLSATPLELASEGAGGAPAAAVGNGSHAIGTQAGSVGSQRLISSVGIVALVVTLGAVAIMLARRRQQKRGFVQLGQSQGAGVQLPDRPGSESDGGTGGSSASHND